ncbi:hypothetical protein J2S47_003380 [Streptomyces griseoviridis]|uniref:Uncharacterized protein n=1 Tax=Streptomyces griseoviridis TaxID=45398 RepID=A0ABT9LGM7_STRGD|nr:hypothetical protein [Streptomyces griseoviridis]
MPAPPPRQSSPVSVVWSTVIEPAGGPRRMMSPDRARCTRALETQPAGTAFTWGVGNPSERGADAKE